MLFDLQPGLLHRVVDLALRLVRDVLVGYAGREASDHDGAYRELGRAVDEHPRLVGPVVPRQLVHDPAFERPDGLLIDRADVQPAVPDDDERIMLALLLLARIAPLADRCLEGHVQVRREYEAEELLAGPVLLSVDHLRLRWVDGADLLEDLQ